ncbi:MAG TPA: glycosyltransferase [Acidimicrobiales bacterium]|nr:glycosyltransferase [Acidimicrobiales bacterium]
MPPTPAPSGAFSYVLPIASARPADIGLDGYLAWVGSLCDLVVVDDSPPDVFAEHHRRWSRYGRHVAPQERTLCGKVGNVLTGLRLAAHDRVVVADDDVRYGAELFELVARLDQADVARPQNYFLDLPWHAVWDSGRSLLNRLLGGDWPGTLAVRRTPLLAAGGYAGDVLFENYELCRTVEAAGGRHVLAVDVFVGRVPPSARHFLGQRVRQAYDEWARPVRMASFLAVAPALALAGARWGRAGASRAAALLGLLAIGAAEGGRRRAGATSVFPLRCSLAAPLWVAERSICSWAAVVARLRGGVVYRDRRIERAALSDSERARRVAAALAHGASPAA